MRDNETIVDIHSEEEVVEEDKNDEVVEENKNEEIVEEEETLIDSLVKELKSEINDLKVINTDSGTPRSNTSYDVIDENNGTNINDKKRRKKIDTLVYDEDHEDTKCNQCSEEELEILRKKWSKHKKHRLHRCLWKLKYNRIVSSFYLDHLRRKEEYWSWMIIVISTLTSGLTVANNVETEPIDNYNTGVNILLTFSSMSTSLIAAWIKKQRFVEKINEIDKYLLNINSLCEELEIQFSLLEEDRLSYDEFKKKYIPEITKYVTSNPIIPPNEWKNCVREITIKYPELVDPDNSEANKLWPWYGDLVKCSGEDGKVYNIRKPTTFMKHMKRTNKDKLLSKCCFKKEFDDVY